MPKNTGASNYKVAEIMRLLDIVRVDLPLGKDEWERVALKYNTTKADHWSERDFESLRRKFKQLYLMRKPTGEADVPAHIQAAKDLKVAIDDKAGVIDLEDAADGDARAVVYDAGEAEAKEDEESPRQVPPMNWTSINALMDQSQSATLGLASFGPLVTTSASRRRDEKEAMEERRRFDKKDAAARMKEMVLLISTLSKQSCGSSHLANQR